jgi:hypothetical protein
VTGGFDGGLREYLGGRHYTSIVGALPYRYADLLYDLGVELREDEPEKVFRALDRLGVRVIFVAERPLDNSGGFGRSGFGDWCYRVTMPEAAVLGAFVDHHVATGRENAAYGVLYDEQAGEPVLELVEEDDPSRIECPLEVCS